MDVLRPVSGVPQPTMLAGINALRGSLRTLLGWTVGVVSREVELVAILSQSLTLFLLSLLVARLGKPAARP